VRLGLALVVMTAGLTGCYSQTEPEAVRVDSAPRTVRPSGLTRPTVARPPDWSQIKPIRPRKRIARLPASGLTPAPVAAWPGGAWVFAALKKRLVASGFKRKKIDRLFASPSVRYLPKTVLIRLRVRETKALYRGFTTAAVVRRTQRWLMAHRRLLNKNQKLYGVPPEIIAALFMIETRLGGNQGRFPVFNVLATLAATRGPGAARAIRGRLDPKSRRKRNEKYILAWLEKKSDWAFRELTALIRYADKNRVDIHALKGSFAGALGICQFLPSNALNLGVDGNRDGRVLLHHLDDAVPSAGRYLKHHGWRPGLDAAGQRAVLMKYNRSRPYVDAVMTLAKKVHDLDVAHIQAGRMGSFRPVVRP
jgi:membrane-bound lytic murein transglycosylase B